MSEVNSIEDKGHNYSVFSWACLPLHFAPMSSEPLVEAAISRIKSRGGATLRSRTFGAQSQEIAFRIAAANKAVRHAKPVTARAT